MFGSLSLLYSYGFMVSYFILYVYDISGKRIHPLALISMSLISVGILATAIFIHPFLLALWPKIPRPENKFNGVTVSTKFLEPQQVW